VDLCEVGNSLADSCLTRMSLTGDCKYDEIMKPGLLVQNSVLLFSVTKKTNNTMDFSCGCLLDKKIKEPRFKKSKHFEDLSASFAINAKNEQLGAQ
jgi:hypothetical protein